MSVAPTREQVALEAARYAVREFKGLDSWFSYEDELAKEWLKSHEFVCAIDYATKQVIEHMRWNRRMQTHAAQYGSGARGIARIAGSVVGEWTSGHTTLDRELESW